MAGGQAKYKAMVTTEIRVCLSHIQEKNVGSLLGNDFHILERIGAASNTTIEWDQKYLTAYIAGEPKAAKKAYTLLTAHIEKFAFIHGADYSPEESINMFGWEFRNGLCFYQTRDGVESSGEGGGGSGSERSASPLMKRATRRFVLYPADLDAKEELQGRAAAGDHLHQSEFVTHDMKHAVIQYASVTLKKQMMNPLAGLQHYLKVELSLGKHVFFENDTEGSKLDCLKFSMEDFRHLSIGKRVATVFKKRWRKSWITELRALLPKLGYKKKENAVTVVELLHKEQRSTGKFHDVTWSTIRQGDGTTDNLVFVKSHIRNKCAFAAGIFNPATRFDLKLEAFSYERESDDYNNDAQDRLRKYFTDPASGFSANSALCQDRMPLIGLTVKVKGKTSWVRTGVKVSIIEFQRSGLESTFEVRISSGIVNDITKSMAVAELPNTTNAVNALLEAGEEISDKLMVLNDKSFFNERVVSLGPAQQANMSVCAPARNVELSRPEFKLYTRTANLSFSLESGKVAIKEDPPALDPRASTAGSQAMSSDDIAPTPEFSTPPPSYPGGEEFMIMEWVNALTTDRGLGTQFVPEVLSPSLPDSPTIPGERSRRELFDARLGRPTPFLTQHSNERQLESSALSQEQGALAEASRIGGARVRHYWPEFIPNPQGPGVSAVAKTAQSSHQSPAVSPTPSPDLPRRPLSPHACLIDSPQWDVDKLSKIGLLTPRKTYCVAPKPLVKKTVDFFSLLDPHERGVGGGAFNDDDLLSWSPERHPSPGAIDELKIEGLALNDDLLVD